MREIVLTSAEKDFYNVGMVWYLCYDCTSHFNIPSAPQRIYFTHSLARSSFSYAYYLVAFSLLYIPGECGGLHVTALYKAVVDHVQWIYRRLN